MSQSIDRADEKKFWAAADTEAERLYRTSYQTLVQWFQPYSKVFVAFSGGVDSALVLRAAIDGAGAQRVAAVTADSPSLPRAEFDQIKAMISGFGVEWIILNTDELNKAEYRANSGDRCYHCKQTLYNGIDKIVCAAGQVAVDGTNTGDLGDHRPGLRAAAEHKIKHPLVESRFDKSLVRAVSRRLGLVTADKPAMACLSSRIPVGTEVTIEKLSRIERAEAGLKSLGFSQLRVRYHELNSGAEPDGLKLNLLARIELAPDELHRATIDPELRRAMIEAVNDAGFDLVTLDLAGYKGAAADDLITLPDAAHKVPNIPDSDKTGLKL